MSLNHVAITGNLTRDPDLRMTSGNGTTVLNFGVAVNDRHRNQQTGEWEDRPNFIDCALFGSRANAMVQMLRKGSKVAIIGKLRQTSWERDGQRRNKIEVIVEDIDLMTRKDAGSVAYQANPDPANRGYGQPDYQQAAYGY